MRWEEMRCGEVGQVERLIDRQAVKWEDRLTDRQTDRHIDRQMTR